MDRENSRPGKGSDDNLYRYRQKRQWRRRLLRIGVPLLVAALLLVLFFALLRIFFVVKEITVIGSEQYTEEDILKEAGIERNDNILLLSEKEIDRRLRQAFPYIKQVTLEKAYPSSVTLKIEEEYITFCLELGGEYFLFNTGMRLMDRFDSLSTLQESRETAIIVKTPLPESCIVPQYIQYSDKNQYVCDIMKIISECDFIEGIREIDLTDKYSITANYLNQVEIHFGDMKNFETKIRICHQLLSECGSSPCGHIDFSAFPDVYYALENQEAG